MSFEFQAGETTVMPDGLASAPAISSNVDEIASTVGGSDHGAACHGAVVATLFVFLDDDGILHWKAAAKGARWHNSKSTSMGEVCRQADSVMPERYEIDYVEARS